MNKLKVIKESVEQKARGYPKLANCQGICIITPTPARSRLIPTRRDFPSELFGQQLRCFEQLQMVFSKWQGRFEQLTYGPFLGTLLLNRGKHIHAFQTTANKSILARGREAPGMMSIALVLPEGASCVWQHRKLDAGRIVVRETDADVNHHTSKQSVHTDLLIPQELFRKAVRTLSCVDPVPIGWIAVQPVLALPCVLPSRES